MNVLTPPHPPTPPNSKNGENVQNYTDVCGTGANYTENRSQN